MKFAAVHRHLPALMVLSLMLTGALGCGRVHRVYHVPSSVALSNESSAPFDLAYLAPSMGTLTSQTLLVRVTTPTQTIDLESAKVLGLKSEQEWSTWTRDFQNEVADVLWHQRLFADISTPADRQPQLKPDLTLDIAITRWHEGNGFLRYFLGFGLGATDMQWEGQLRDTSGTLLLAWADRRIHPGGPSYVGSLSLRPFRGWKLIGEDLTMATRDLAQTIAEAQGKKLDPNPRRRWERHPQYRITDGKAKPRDTQAAKPLSPGARPAPGTRSHAILPPEPAPAATQPTS